ncbi:hypothetical protein Tco_1418011 [Tanacetum coccineum]
MASFNYRLNSLYAIKECSSCEALYTRNCGCSKGSLEDKILVPVPDSSQQPLIFEKMCLNCGDPVHGLYCRKCALIRQTLGGVFQDLLNTFESSDDDTNVANAPREPFVTCGNGAHIGYNCPPKAPIISNPEPCNQTIDELPQTLPSFDPTCYSEKENSLPYVSKPNFVDDSPNVFNPPPQPPMYSCEFCGNDARYGHYCTPQVPFIYPEPCYNQDFNFQQDFHDFQQQYLCCENCGGPHETFQCQPMNEDYYHEQNSCYDSNSFGFDQFQPPQYTVNHPIFNAQNELLNSQNKIMEQMTSICDMVGQIMQKKEEERRIAEDQAAKDRYWKIPICYDDDEDYTIAITPVLSTKEPVDSLIMEDEHLDTIPATKRKSLDLEDILQIQDVILREKLLNISRLITNIESLNDNPTPDHVFKSPSSFPIPITDSDSFFEKSDTSFCFSDNSLPEFEPFSDDMEERTRSELTNVVIEEVDTFLVSEDSIPPGIESNFDPGGGLPGSLKTLVSWFCSFITFEASYHLLHLREYDYPQNLV